jgi:hypothetical protein
MLGVEGEIGTIAYGRMADFVIFSGDPMDFRSRVAYVVSGGKVVVRDGVWNPQGGTDGAFVPFTGRWTGTARIGRMEMSFEVELEREGETVRGTVRIPRMNREFSFEGRVEGHELRMRFQQEGAEGEIVLTQESPARITGSIRIQAQQMRMQGTVELEPAR